MLLTYVAWVCACCLHVVGARNSGTALLLKGPNVSHEVATISLQFGHNFGHNFFAALSGPFCKEIVATLGPKNVLFNTVNHSLVFWRGFLGGFWRGFI
jgi:hypothetical protein